MFNTTKATLASLFRKKDETSAAKDATASTPQSQAYLMPPKPQSRVADLYLSRDESANSSMTVSPLVSTAVTSVAATTSSKTFSTTTHASLSGVASKAAVIFALPRLKTAIPNFDRIFEMIKNYLTKEYLLTKYPPTFERSELLNIADYIFDTRVTKNTLKHLECLTDAEKINFKLLHYITEQLHRFEAFSNRNDGSIEAFVIDITPIIKTIVNSNMGEVSIAKREMSPLAESPALK